MHENLKKLGSVNALLWLKYTINAAGELESTERKKPSFALGTACVVARQQLWVIERTYALKLLPELKNLINAEKATKLPLKGEVFWQFRLLSDAKKFKLTFFVLPSAAKEQIPDDCLYIIPEHDRVEDESPFALLSTEGSTQTELLKTADTLSYTDLFSLRTKTQVSKATQKMSNKTLGIALSALAGAALLSTSLYTEYKLSTLQALKLANEPVVDEALLKRKTLDGRGAQIEGLTVFFAENPNVLNKLALIDTGDIEVMYDQVVIIPTGAQLRGRTANATALLQKYSEAEHVSEAKFTRALIKHNSGKEIFSIQVDWK
ncbi:MULTISPECIES: hypothetical protein [unclassified Pseudoalteromonas]|uniref:hypothetical protein n=1 Tax=unclassified Pseudoalteromonas TaxID=194690 RepID=UPI000C7B17E3|nr:MULTISPECIES: hypothetical protein [unclassified Pseudoalteromonas]AUJ68881.1 hypothetical protein PNC201_02725 [Pseudoalteromonas sp. NC201]MCF2825854.1 hypothetical protein [Pseudoalteromonas sp. OF5H-5]MCF2832629.1 hypothetical protein [Pseudoalteromonas sp. DL2-H6]MCF2927276.1 hypothetical protein [Pseudoalteromonas sp. DL2-H1]MCF7513908.1 hypothetical protein [Pseudoalteromonas sp. L7]